MRGRVPPLVSPESGVPLTWVAGPPFLRLWFPRETATDFPVRGEARPSGGRVDHRERGVAVGARNDGAARRATVRRVRHHPPRPGVDDGRADRLSEPVRGGGGLLRGQPLRALSRLSATSSTPFAPPR